MFDKAYVRTDYDNDNCNYNCLVTDYYILLDDCLIIDFVMAVSTYFSLG